MIRPLKVDSRRHNKRTGGFNNSSNKNNESISTNVAKTFGSNLSYENKHRSSVSPGHTTLRVGRQTRSSSVKVRHLKSKFLKRTSMDKVRLCVVLSSFNTYVVVNKCCSFNLTGYAYLTLM